MNRPSDPHQHDELLAASHTHGPECEHCGAAKGIERSYEVDDRALQTLLRALAIQHKLDAYQKGRSKKRWYVFGPNSASLDRFDETLTRLGRQLDDQILQHTVAFIHEHTGVDLTIGPGKPE